MGMVTLQSRCPARRRAAPALAPGRAFVDDARRTGNEQYNASRTDRPLQTPTQGRRRPSSPGTGPGLTHKSKDQ